MNKYNKGFVPVTILIIVLGVLAVGGVAYFVGKSSAPKNEPSDNSNYVSPVEQNQNPPTTSNNNTQTQTAPPQTPTPNPTPSAQQGFISPTQGSTLTLGSDMSIKIKTSPQWFHCSNGFYLYNANGQEIGPIGILTESGKTSYSWTDTSKRYATCGTGVGEIPISVSAGSYKICLKETNTETGVGNNFHCSGLFNLTSSQPQTNNVTDYPAYLISAYSQNNKNYIDVDYIEVLSGTASLQAQVADGKCPNINDCYDFPNGYK